MDGKIISVSLKTPNWKEAISQELQLSSDNTVPLTDLYACKSENDDDEDERTDVLQEGFTFNEDVDDSGSDVASLPSQLSSGKSSPTPGYETPPVNQLSQDLNPLDQVTLQSKALPPRPAPPMRPPPPRKEDASIQNTANVTAPKVFYHFGFITVGCFRTL